MVRKYVRDAQGRFAEVPGVSPRVTNTPVMSGTSRIALGNARSKDYVVQGTQSGFRRKGDAEAHAQRLAQAVLAGDEDSLRGFTGNRTVYDSDPVAGQEQARREARRARAQERRRAADRARREMDARSRAQANDVDARVAAEQRRLERVRAADRRRYNAEARQREAAAEAREREARASIERERAEYEARQREASKSGPSDGSVKPAAGGGYKATGPDGISSFFKSRADADAYAAGQPGAAARANAPVPGVGKYRDRSTTGSADNDRVPSLGEVEKKPSLLERGDVTASLPVGTRIDAGDGTVLRRTESGWVDERTGKTYSADVSGRVMSGPDARPRVLSSTRPDRIVSDTGSRVGGVPAGDAEVKAALSAQREASEAKAEARRAAKRERARRRRAAARA